MMDFPTHLPTGFIHLKLQQKDDKSPASQRVLLPFGFEPTPYTVILGRGKKCTDAIGNRRLKVIASQFLERYAKATTRDDKSEVVSEIKSIVQSACPQGSFVKQGKNGQWIQVEDNLIREKIGQVLRDSLHTKYRSSVKSKIAARRIRRASGFSTSSSNSTGCSECTSSVDSNEAKLPEPTVNASLKEKDTFDFFLEPLEHTMQDDMVDCDIMVGSDIFVPNSFF